MDLSSYTGNITKAVLVFLPANMEELEINTLDSRQKNSLLSMSDSISKVVDKEKKAALEKGLNRYKNAMLAGSFGGLVNEELLDDSKKLQFQFNPSTLQISAYGGGIAPKANYNTGGQGSSISYGSVDETITVSFRVIFDATNNSDAFLRDKLNVLNPTNAAKSAVKGIARAMGKGTDYTVRPVVEGFLGAVRNEENQKVIFQWGKLRYMGRMNRVQCRYTMFSPSGEPIRAEVGISILACSVDASRDYMSYWRNRYNKIMQGEDSSGLNGLMKQAAGGGDAFSTDNVSNSFTNLLNLQM